MKRLSLAACLFLFASAALAGTPAAGDDAAAGSGKPGKATAVTATQDNDVTATGNPTATPARSAAPRTVSRRWHSLLPGMIR